ncbi:MAG TPA: transferrin receptor-like dimerization domain-containing protein [Candidatus Acidoferrum sp.]|nr:transferrin receptor-like dimerization domain-containing protein [Candidatus Acidoferrum sp.]
MLNLKNLLVCAGLVSAGIAWFSITATATADETPLYGYSAESSRAERQWEEKLRALPSPENMRAYMQRLSARPHNVGSPYDKDNAEWLLAKFKEFGFDAQIETYDVLFPTPKERQVELLECKGASTTDCAVKFTAKLEEPALAQDPTSGQKSEQLPTYNAYSRDGDVVAPLVYVNYGIPEDYERLERLGISVKGAIAIARYGHSWRGIKPKVAAEHGAVGCLIYSDPEGDGYGPGDTFPKGAYRPADGVQRGSVADDPIFPGDPLTPGVAAKKDAKRLKIEDSPVITKIPVLPISYGDAQPLLAALTGPVVPGEWRGNLPLTYHVGPSALKVHLKMKSNWDLKTIYDVIAKIPGSTNPDQWVIRGNHHDAWVNGAEDPISGLVAELEEARAFGELLKSGWKPKRTIIYCAWDGEEPGLLGSTEWVEDHGDELMKHAVVYINSDSNGRGYFGPEGSHTLEKFINDVARDVQDPETKLSVWKRAQLATIAEASSADDRAEARNRPDLRIGALGSGSDYGAFVQHDGIASLNLGYGGEDGGGIYHSIYDDFYWYTHFSDTDFVYGRALAQTSGTAVMRLADADILPFEFTDFADTMQTYAKELKTLLEKKQEEVRERNRQIEEGVFQATFDPRRPTVAPKTEPVAPFINFAPLDNAITDLAKAADAYKKAYDQASTSGDLAKATASSQDLNHLLIESERRLTNPEGLPGRPWFKHEIYAPGQYTGYEAKTIPGVREALELKHWKEAEEQVPVAARTLQQETALINEATAKLSALH